MAENRIADSFNGFFFGAMIRQIVRVKQGIAQDVAKKISKTIKDSKKKVQVSIQGDELRVSGKKNTTICKIRSLSLKRWESTSLCSLSIFGIRDFIE